jgi:hypothetical protein
MPGIGSPMCDCRRPLMKGSQNRVGPLGGIRFQRTPPESISTMIAPTRYSPVIAAATIDTAASRSEPNSSWIKRRPSLHSNGKPRAATATYSGISETSMAVGTRYRKHSWIEIHVAARRAIRTCGSWTSLRKESVKASALRERRRLRRLPGGIQTGRSSMVPQRTRERVGTVSRSHAFAQVAGDHGSLVFQALSSNGVALLAALQLHAPYPQISIRRFESLSFSFTRVPSFQKHAIRPPLW